MYKANCLTFLLLFFLSSATLQGQVIFEQGQVDQQAKPIGGQAMLIDFIRHNIRVPFANRVEGLQGRVDIKGVIEPDGSTSSLEIVKGLNKESDEEVLRIFRLFRAWEPAKKEGKSVRQAFNYGLQLGAEKLENFDAGSQELVFYFDNKRKGIAVPEKAEYRLNVGVDANGIPKDEFRFGTRQKKGWGELEIVNTGPYQLSRDVAAQLLGVDETNLFRYLGTSDAVVAKVAVEPFEIDMPEYILTTDRRVVRELLPGVYSKVFYESGLTARVRIFEGANIAQNIGWHANSVLKEKYFTEFFSDGVEVDKIVALYDSSGNALLKDGSGEVLVPGFKWGMGTVKNGFLDGIWKSASSDGSIQYEETYERGRFKVGRRTHNGKEVTYAVPYQNPGYKGGPEKLYPFLAKNIRYPSDASSRKIQGRVVVGFVIEPDGSISDVAVERSVHPSLDQEAMRVVTLTSGSWVPAEKRGVAIRSKYTMPVNFQIQ
jgi:TonB family protein